MRQLKLARAEGPQSGPRAEPSRGAFPVLGRNAPVGKDKLEAADESQTRAIPPSTLGPLLAQPASSGSDLSQLILETSARTCSIGSSKSKCIWLTSQVGEQTLGPLGRPIELRPLGRAALGDQDRAGPTARPLGGP